MEAIHKKIPPFVKKSNGFTNLMSLFFKFRNVNPLIKDKWRYRTTLFQGYEMIRTVSGNVRFQNFIKEPLSQRGMRVNIPDLSCI